MALSEVLKHIDEEISKLQQARQLLVGSEQGELKAPRKPRSANKDKEQPAGAKPKRKLSAEGRQAIAEAMKRRWAERRATAEA